MPDSTGLNRRHFLKGAGMTALAGAVGAGASTPVIADDDEGKPLFRNGDYDFDTVYDRVGSNCSRWDSPARKFPEEQIRYGMGVATMDFAVPPCVTEALTKRIEHHVFGYMSSQDSLKEAIAAWNGERHDLDIDPDSIVITAGVHPGILAALRAVSPPGSQVALLTPAYSTFYYDFRLTNVVANESEMVFRDGRYEIDWDDLESKLTPDTQAMIVCNPHNPTGNVWTEEELLRIGRMCLDKQVVVLSDEIHGEFVRDGYEYVPFAKLPDKAVVDNSVSFNSASKSFNLAGLRNAYLFCTNPVLLERMKLNHFATVGTLGCVSNEAAYREGAEWLDQLLAYIDDNHKFVERYVTENLPQVGYKKAEGTFLSWLDFNSVADAIGASDRAAADGVTPEEYMQAWLVKESGVYLNPGSMYGAGSDGHMRLNVGSSRKVIKGALDGLAGAVNSV